MITKLFFKVQSGTVEICLGVRGFFGFVLYQILECKEVGFMYERD